MKRTAIRRRITDYLAVNGAIDDGSGKATAALREALGYEGSSAGFTQLVAAMDNAGELTRTLKGKRTYRIAPVGAVSPSGDESAGLTSAPVASDFDYDELAGALLVQVTQSLRAADEPRSDDSGWARRRIERLERRNDELERQLARAKAEVNAMTQDRDGVRRQLELSESNLALLAERPANIKPRHASFENRLQEDEKTLLRQLRRGSPAERPERAS
jgi:hypothetical protein